MMSEHDIGKIKTFWQTIHELIGLQTTDLETCMPWNLPLVKRKDKVTQWDAQEFSQDLKLGVISSTGLLPGPEHSLFSEAFKIPWYGIVCIAKADVTKPVSDALELTSSWDVRGASGILLTDCANSFPFVMDTADG